MKAQHSHGCLLDLPIVLIGRPGPHREGIRRLLHWLCNGTAHHGAGRPRFRFVDAIDESHSGQIMQASNLNRSQWHELEAKHDRSFNGAVRISRKEVAVTLSHVRAAQVASEMLHASNDEAVLVLEDDVLLESAGWWPLSLAGWLNRARASGLPSDWQAVMLQVTDGGFPSMAAGEKFSLSPNWAKLRQRSKAHDGSLVVRAPAVGWQSVESISHRVWGAVAVLYSRGGVRALGRATPNISGRLALPRYDWTAKADIFLYDTLASSTFVAVPPLFLHPIPRLPDAAGKVWRVDDYESYLIRSQVYAARLMDESFCHPAPSCMHELETLLVMRSRAPRAPTPPSMALATTWAEVCPAQGVPFPFASMGSYDVQGSPACCVQRLEQLLVGIVADSRTATRQRVMRNMALFSALRSDGIVADFGIIAYDNQASAWQDVRDFASSVATRVLLLEDGQRSATFHPKLQYQRRFARLLDGSSHQAIFLLDSDMTFQDTSSVQAFLHHWACAWAKPPLVAQPVLGDNTSWTWLDRMSHWQNPEHFDSPSARVRRQHLAHDTHAGAAMRAPAAVETRFVQQQATLLDADFFRDFARATREFSRMQDEWGTDHGTDTLWCALAARALHGRSGSARRPGCAVIITPIEHDDSRTINNNRTAFHERGARFIQKVLLPRSAEWFGDLVSSLLKEAHATIGMLPWQRALPRIGPLIHRHHECARAVGSIRYEAVPMCENAARRSRAPRAPTPPSMALATTWAEVCPAQGVPFPFASMGSYDVQGSPACCVQRLEQLLVGIVADSRTATRQRVMRNMALFSALRSDGIVADFGIIAYDNQASAWQDVRDFASSVATRVLLLEDGQRSATFHPKLQYQRRFARLLDGSSHQAIFLLDSDMTFQDTSSVQAFLHHWACAWAKPPLVAQPVLGDNTSWTWLDRMSHWQNPEHFDSPSARVRRQHLAHDTHAGAAMRAPAAVETRFVQQQATLLDADFFRDFARATREFSRMQDEWGTDHGTDTLWCALAARALHGRSGSARRPGCAVIITPIEHDDSRTINNNRTAFHERGARFIQKVLLPRSAEWFGDLVSSLLKEAHETIDTLYWDKALPWMQPPIDRNHECAHAVGSIRYEAAPMCDQLQVDCSCSDACGATFSEGWTRFRPSSDPLMMTMANRSYHQRCTCHNVEAAGGGAHTVRRTRKLGVAGGADGKPVAPSVLIVSIVSATVVMKLRRGITHLSKSEVDVGWAVIPYDAPALEECRQGEAKCLTVHSQFGALIRFARAHNTSLSVLSSMRLKQSKLPLQRQPELLELSRRFRFVWLTDSDIEFNGFDIARFFRYHHAAGDPIISQPLIWQKTQAAQFGVNAMQWMSCDWERTKFAATTFVEQQVPLFDSDFFRWFMSTKAVAFLSEYQRALPIDWGVDHLWCGAAMLFATRTNDSHRPPCATIMASISHVQGNGSSADRFPKMEDYQHRGRHAIALTFHAAGFEGNYVQEYALLNATSAPGGLRIPADFGYYLEVRTRYPLPALSPAARSELATFVHGQTQVCTSRGVVLNNPWVRSFAEMTC